MGVFDTVLRTLQKVRWPNMMAAADDVLEGGAREFMSVTAPELKAFRNFLPTEDVGNWLREDLPKAAKGIVSTAKGALHEFMSPDLPLGRSQAGKEVYNVALKADLDTSYARATLLNPFDKLARKVTEEGSTKAYRAMENPSLLNTLSKDERNLVDHTKNNFDFLWKSYIYHTVGRDKNDFNRVIRMADKGLTPEELEILPEHLQEGYRLAKSTIKDYVPHTWKREDLIPMLENSRMQNVLKYQKTESPEIKSRLKKVIGEYDDSLRKLNGGDPLSYDNIPKEVLFRHGLLRKGALGYEEDLVRSYRSYVYHLTKKMIEEPALKRMAESYNALPFEQRPYAKWFIRDFAGLNAKSPLDRIAGAISSFEYTRALGFNLRSPITNLTQQLNTWADAGLPWSIKGYVRAFTKEGTELWDKSKLAVQVPQVLTDQLHPGAGKVERFKRIAGTLFNMAEMANRKHAFLTYLSKYENKFGAGAPEAFEEAIKGVYRTQFAYGRVGMPKVLRTPVGRVAGQFGSFTIKQMEFLGKQIKELPGDIKNVSQTLFSPEFSKKRGEELWKIAKENPLKFIQWAGMAEGGNVLMGDVFGIDLSNALGFGLSFGEALESFRSMTKGEFDEMWAHGAMAFSQGSGILPSGPGPGLQAAFNIGKALKSGEGVGEAIVKELTPVQWTRVEDILVSIKNRGLAREEGNVPIGKTKGLPFSKDLTDIGFEQGMARTVSEAVFKSKQRTDVSEKQFKQSRMDILESKRKRLIAEMIASGKQDQAQTLIEKYGVVPTRDAIYEAVLRRTVPKGRRPKQLKADERQLLRELRKEVEEE
jgi:hypothetical protein